MGAKVGVMVERDSYNSDDLSVAYDDNRPLKEVALVCLLEMTGRFSTDPTSNENTGLSPFELSCMSRVSPSFAMEAMIQLESVGLISILNNGDGRLCVLKFNPANLLLSDFVNRIAWESEDGFSPALNAYANQWFWQEHDSAVSQKFSGLTLQDLYDKVKGQQQGQQYKKSA